jgi:hypothetical protein
MDHLKMSVKLSHEVPFFDTMYIQSANTPFLTPNMLGHLKVHSANKVGVFGGVQGFRWVVHRGWSSRVSVKSPKLVIEKRGKEYGGLTRLSKTHLLSFHSAGRHCQSCWLLLSRQVQCLRNSSRQCLFTSSRL